MKAMKNTDITPAVALTIFRALFWCLIKLKHGTLWWTWSCDPDWSETGIHLVHGEVILPYRQFGRAVLPLFWLRELHRQHRGLPMVRGQEVHLCLQQLHRGESLLKIKPSNIYVEVCRQGLCKNLQSGIWMMPPHTSTLPLIHPIVSLDHAH